MKLVNEEKVNFSDLLKAANGRFFIYVFTNFVKIMGLFPVLNFLPANLTKKIMKKNKQGKAKHMVT